MKFTEGVYLAGIPVVGTGIAYIFEAGFANFHGIPASLIQLSISQLVGTSVLGLLGLWVLHIYFSTGIAYLARRKHLVFKFIGLGMLYAAFPLLLIVGLGASDINAWMVVAIFFFMPSAMSLVEAVTSKDKSMPFAQRWWDKAASTFESTPSSRSDGLDALIDTPQVVFFIALFVIFLAFSLGHRYASVVAPTLVLKSDPSRALVVVYGDKWFFRSVDEVGKPLGRALGDLVILTGDSVKEVVLRSRQKAQANANETERR